MMKTIYLCGPINGCADQECRDWRESAKSALAGRYNILDPMRRDFRGREDESVREIVRGDLEDITFSDVVLAMADRPSWGTAMEIYQAFRWGREVVVVCGQESISPWLRHCATRMFGSLRAAIEFLSAD